MNKTIKNNKTTIFHPGEYLNDAIEALEITPKDFSIRSDISEDVVLGVIDGTTNVDFNTADKLSKFFGNSVDFWLNLQNSYNEYLIENK